MIDMIEATDKSNPGWRTEVCDCKHFRVVHGHRGLAPGHGACLTGGCPCGQFTWVESPTVSPRVERRLERFRARRSA